MTLQSPEPQGQEIHQAEQTLTTYPDAYARLALAIAQHAKSPSESRQLLETISASPPPLLDQLARLLQRKQGTSPTRPIRRTLPIPQGITERFPAGTFFMNQDALHNGLDETFWQTVLSECADLLDKFNGDAMRIPTEPISVTFRRTIIDPTSALIRMTAYAATSQGETVIGQAVVLDQLKDR